MSKKEKRTEQTSANVDPGKVNDNVQNGVAPNLAAPKDEKDPVVAEGEAAKTPKAKAVRFSDAELDKVMELTFQFVQEGMSKDDAKAKARESVLAERVTNATIDREALQAFVTKLVHEQNENDKGEMGIIRDGYALLSEAVKALYERQESAKTAILEAVNSQFGERGAALVQLSASYKTDNTMLPACIVSSPIVAQVRERKPIVHAAGYVRPVGVLPSANYDYSKLTEKQSKLFKALLQVGFAADGLWHNEQYRKAYQLAFGEQRNTNFNLTAELPCNVKVYNVSEMLKTKAAQIIAKHQENMARICKS